MNLLPNAILKRFFIFVFWDVLISAFVSREYGFGIDLSAEDLARVNEKRDGEKYSDDVAAKVVNGNQNKTPLTSNPFVIEFKA